MGLALDVGLGGLALRVEGVEVLLQPMLGRDPGVDGAAQTLDLASSSRPRAGRRSEVRSSACL